MAGHHYDSLHEDPAIMRYGKMNAERYKYFRWTPRTVRLTFIYVVCVPAVFGIAAYSTDGKWNFRGKLRGDSVREF